MIKSPIGENILHRLNKSYIGKFNQCWIPDIEQKENLSGDLSHKFPLPQNAKYIGILSRFSIASSSTKKNDQLLVILSGPEPQRSIFEKKIIDQIQKNKIKALIVQGITEKNDTKILNENCRIVSHLNAEDFEEEISSSKYILCRSGYSTIMDLAVLRKKNIIFVPTPGQTEQEYLAERFSKNKTAYSVSQKNFDLSSAIKECSNYSGFISDIKNEDFKSVIDELLKSL